MLTIFLVLFTKKEQFFTQVHRIFILGLSLAVVLLLVPLTGGEVPVTT